jgi:hypothetical protein
LSETEPIVLPLVRRAGGDGNSSEGGARRGGIAFDRRELTQILNVYGRKVASGEWRDYAIDTMKEKAVFSVFRRSSECPLYRIEKAPKLARRQGACCARSTAACVWSRPDRVKRKGPDEMPGPRVSSICFSVSGGCRTAGAAA